MLDPTFDVARPHDDADRGRRVARRILQRLMGMGKWGGYHTEISHLARGFAGHDRALALAIGERLLRPACCRRSRASASATSSSTPDAPPRSTRSSSAGETPRGLELPVTRR